MTPAIPRWLRMGDDAASGAGNDARGFFGYDYLVGDGNDNHLARLAVTHWRVVLVQISFNLCSVVICYHSGLPMAGRGRVAESYQFDGASHFVGALNFFRIFQVVLFWLRLHCYNQVLTLCDADDFQDCVLSQAKSQNKLHFLNEAGFEKKRGDEIFGQILCGTAYRIRFRASLPRSCLRGGGHIL